MRHLPFVDVFSMTSMSSKERFSKAGGAARSEINNIFSKYIPENANTVKKGYTPLLDFLVTCTEMSSEGQLP